MQNEIRCSVWPQTPRQLAAKYGISVRSLKKKTDKFADKIGERVTHFFTPKQVRTIYECIGIPKYPELKVAYRKNAAR